MAPKNLPPVYSEFPTLPFLGSIVQYVPNRRMFASVNWQEPRALLLSFFHACVFFLFLPHFFFLFFFLFLPPTLTYMTRLHVGACVCDIFLRTDPITHDVVHDVGWLGVRRYATCPRDFLQRAQKKCGNTFTVKLMGWNMTYFMSSEGHHTFFSAKEEVYDIREAYKCTVVTFGPGVCYDCPVRKMGEQLGT